MSIRNYRMWNPNNCEKFLHTPDCVQKKLLLIWFVCLGYYWFIPYFGVEDGVTKGNTEKLFYTFWFPTSVSAKWFRQGATDLETDTLPGRTFGGRVIQRHRPVKWSHIQTTFCVGMVCKWSVVLLITYLILVQLYSIICIIIQYIYIYSIYQYSMYIYQYTIYCSKVLQIKNPYL